MTESSSETADQLIFTTLLPVRVYQRRYSVQPSTVVSVSGAVTMYVVYCAESDDGGPSHDWLWEPPSLPNST